MPWIFLCLFSLPAAADQNMGFWDQWMGNSTRSLTAGDGVFPSTNMSFRVREIWRRVAGGSFSGLSLRGDNATTMTSIDGRDAVVMLDSQTGAERWSYRLGRTRKRAEGVPLGPLSTPALDERAVYAQSLDGVFVALSVTDGRLLWEVNLKAEFGAYEPAYGFASSPLLAGDKIILLPAGSSSASVLALERSSGKPVWRSKLGSGAEYASPTLLPDVGGGLVVGMLADKLVGLLLSTGALQWTSKDTEGGLWTPSVLPGKRVFVPAAKRSFLLALDSPDPQKQQQVWSSEVFEGVMGPVVYCNGLLIGHDKKRLTCLDAATGAELWRETSKTDGQLLAWGDLLILVDDRTGKLKILHPGRLGLQLLHESKVMKPVRMETPLSWADHRLYIRSPLEIIALDIQAVAAN